MNWKNKSVVLLLQKFSCVVNIVQNNLELMEVVLSMIIEYLSKVLGWITLFVLINVYVWYV